MGPLLARQLEQRGIAKDFLRQVVITHAHPDHVMAVPLFREMFPGITVAASETAANTLSSAKAISFFRQVDDVLTGSLMRDGQITEEYRTAPLVEEQIAIDRLEAHRIEGVCGPRACCELDARRDPRIGQAFADARGGDERPRMGRSHTAAPRPRVSGLRRGHPERLVVRDVEPARTTTP